MFESSFIQDFLNQEAVQSLRTRVAELQKRVIRAGSLLMVFFAAFLVFSKELLVWLQSPLNRSLSHLTKKQTIGLHFTGPLEVMFAQIQVAFACALTVLAPYLLWELFAYLRPSLEVRQQKSTRRFLIASVLLFFVGIFFAFFVILPPSLSILIEMGLDVATPVISIGDYIGLLFGLELAFGGMFQLPVVLVVLERLGLVTREGLTAQRSYAVVFILIVAAIATPTPDPFTQLMMAGPLYALFEASVFFMPKETKKG